MPLSQRIARFNKVVTNPVMGRMAPWMPGFGVVHHQGRKSGRVYRTPVIVFRRENGYVVALTYGSGADWVQNVLAAKGCDLETRRHVVRLVEPGVHTDDQLTGVPAPVRAILRLTRVDKFLTLNRTKNR